MFDLNIIRVRIDQSRHHEEGIWMEAIATYFRERRPNFSGTVLIAKKGKIVFHEAFGKSDFETQMKNTLYTQFSIASLTKIFTALAVFQLVEQDKLRLSDPLEKYISDSTYYGVTIQHLLNHTSGIFNYVKEHDALSWDQRYQPEDIWRYIRGKKLHFTPGSKFSYSNSNILLLAMILEKITETSYREYVKKSILTPAGMTNTGFEGEEFPLLAQGHVNGKKKKGWDSQFGYGCADLISTTEDLYRFLQCYKKNQLITRDSKNKMETVSFRRKKWFDVSLIASGWFYRFEHGMSIGHSGAHPAGYVTRWDLNMNHETEIIILSNNVISYNWYGSKWDGAQHISRELGEILFENPLTMLQKIW